MSTEVSLLNFISDERIILEVILRALTYSLCRYTNKGSFCMIALAQVVNNTLLKNFLFGYQADSNRITLEDKLFLIE